MQYIWEVVLAAEKTESGKPICSMRCQRYEVRIWRYPLRFKYADSGADCRRGESILPLF